MTDEIETESAGNIASSGGSSVGAIGAIVAAMGCVNCFPAIAALGASLGLGWMEQCCVLCRIGIHDRLVNF